MCPFGACYVFDSICLWSLQSGTAAWALAAEGLSTIHRKGHQSPGSASRALQRPSTMATFITKVMRPTTQYVNERLHGVLEPVAHLGGQILGALFRRAIGNILEEAVSWDSLARNARIECSCRPIHTCFPIRLTPCVAV